MNHTLFVSRFYTDSAIMYVTLVDGKIGWNLKNYNATVGLLKYMVEKEQLCHGRSAISSER